MSDTLLRDAEQHAEKIVTDYGLTLPIDVFALAKSNEILVSAKPAAALGVSGMLVRNGDDFAIGYATHVRSEGFQRFSIAHELGHFFLPGHPEHIFRDGNLSHESRAGFTSGDHIEMQADHFAAGLLMPSALFAREAGKYSDGFTAIEQLAEICKTSLTASAIRYSEITDAAIAVVLSSRSSVEYCFLSPAMRRIKGINFPRKGAVLPRESLTRRFNQTPENISSSKRDDEAADLQTWFGCDDQLEGWEEVIGLGDYGKTLSILTADADDQDDGSARTGWSAPQFSYKR